LSLLRAEILVLLCLLPVLIVAVPAAAAQVESLGKPCRAKNVLAGTVIDNRHGDGELLALTSSNEEVGLEVILVDLAANTAERYVAPAGSGSWGIMEIPGDRLVISTYYDGKYVIFDLNEMAFAEVIDFPGESYIWQIARGSDGRVYGGTYPGAKVAALDPETLEIEEAAVSPEPNMYASVEALPDGRLLVHFRNDNLISMLYDPATGELSEVPDDLRRGVLWHGYFVTASGVYDGLEGELITPSPIPLPPGDPGTWTPRADITREEALFFSQGNRILRYREGEDGLTLMNDQDLRGMRLFGSTRDGKIVGVRGQDYAVITADAADPLLRPIPVETGPRPILPFAIDDQHRIWGGPHFGQTLFWLDTRTGEYHNTNVICDGGGEVYDVAFLNGKVYAASYAGGDITCYDPSQPWDQWNHVNPRPVASVGPEYIRPVAGIHVAPDGMLYSGWMARYGTYGGAIAITDPETGETELIENPLGEQAVSGLAVGDDALYIGTTLAANGLANKPDEAPRFGMLDLATRELLFQRTFEGASEVARVQQDAATGRVVMSVGGKLHVFDPAAKAFVTEFDGAPTVNSQIALPGDGRALYGTGAVLHAIDLTSGAVTEVVTLPANVTHVAVDSDGSIYVACSSEVFRVTDD